MPKVVKKNKHVIKTDYNIPTFSMKSSLIFVLAATLSTIVVPYILSFVGIEKNFSVVVGNTIILGYAIAYIRCFIESKIGFCKKFWYTYIGFGIAFGFISLFWMYFNSYI